MKLSSVVLSLATLAVAGAFAPRPVVNVMRIRTATSMISSERVNIARPSTALSATASIAAPASASAAKDEGKGLLHTLKIGGLFGLWYALNIGYNIYNKKVLNMVPSLTYTVAWLQLVTGLFYVAPVWALGIRKAPVLNNEEIKNLIPIAVLHSLTHLGAVVSLGAGAVSFTHIVKAAEPAVSAALSAIFLKSFLPLPVYLSLIPVMGGVAMASLTELSFSWLSFIAAMISNVASASRGIVGKMSMGKPQGQNMNAANLYAVMTILSAILIAPIYLAVEWKQIVPTLTAISKAGNLKTLGIQTLLSGIYYYLYNEVAFLALDNVAPVTHALGNTIKRVVIIITSVIVFGSTMSTQGMIGSTIAILGVLLYSLAKNYFK
jgi:solute carrier family 35 protein E1